LQDESVITRTIRTAAGVFAPGQLGELTQVIDFALVDAVLEETGATERRVRLLPSRVVVYFVLALALFEQFSYQGVWAKLTGELRAAGLAVASPAVSSLARARRRVGAAPLRRLFRVLAGPAGLPGTPGVFYRGLRTAAVDGTCLHIPDESVITGRYPKRKSRKKGAEQGYPLLRLLALVECGTRSVLAAAFGPDTDGELPYARKLLAAADNTMLLLADAAFDDARFLASITRDRGAQFLARSGARRCPLPQQYLPDGSYLATIGYGVLKDLLTVRVIEAAITLTLADGTVTTSQWRLLTSLTDPARYPAAELAALYHERWQIETTYYSIKKTILDGRVLRSRSLPGIDQEVWALLTTYQALIHAAAGTALTRPGLDMDQISFTILLHTAASLVTTAAGILPGPDSPPDLAGAIGRAALAALLPARHRARFKARTTKNPTSKYGPGAGQHPATTQDYTVHVQVTYFTEGVAPRPDR
jgi:Insertion element 4 transposase N-terminal/Transposase DDE domain